jgi:hypothetical protein
MTLSFRSILAATAILTAPLATAGTAIAASYDGLWSVLIITQAGSCDAAYSYPFRVAGGRISSAGSFDISGRVSGGGAVQVRISAGGSVANGTGTLGSGGSGAGRWTAKLSGGNCSGRWQATRS